MIDLNLGMEFGSTTIKLTLMTDSQQVVASGHYDWQNSLVDGLWTYALDEVWHGLQQAYAELSQQYHAATGTSLTTIGAIGVSAMMHGYLAFDAQEQLLVPFRTWRNNTTEAAATALSQAFNVNVPQRYSVAHYYQALLAHEPHVSAVAHLTTLAGYVHWRLSGQQCLGIGDASGMFPIDPVTGDYRRDLLARFDQLAAAQGATHPLRELLPMVRKAGQRGGTLTADGARLLDPSGILVPGALMAPPEGDAGTGMVATNSVAAGYGNISVGTSAFAMVVLDELPSTPHRDIDVVMTPSGAPVAMVHANNCAADLNAWMKLFSQVVAALGQPVAPDQLYQALLMASTAAAPDADGLLNYSHLAGENLTAVTAGRPLFVRRPDSALTLANFMRAQLYGAFAPLAIGMQALGDVRITAMVAQGGLFKTPRIAQQVLADELALPITVMPNASAGGPWGMALLALFAKQAPQCSLADFLAQQVFAGQRGIVCIPTPAGVAGSREALSHYQRALPLARLAGDLVAPHRDSKGE